MQTDKLATLSHKEKYTLKFPQAQTVIHAHRKINKYIGQKKTDQQENTHKNTLYIHTDRHT